MIIQLTSIHRFEIQSKRAKGVNTVQDWSKKLREFLTVPNFEECKTVLCVQPHPDDADISMGATVAKLSEVGVKVYYLTVTDGGAGSTDEKTIGKSLRAIRQKEQQDAAQILGVHELIWLDFEDLGDYTAQEVRARVAEHIRKIMPDIVFTVDPFLPYEVHPDHIKTGMGAAQATSLYRLPKIYPGTTDHTVKAIGFFNTAFPNTFYEIEQRHLEKKLMALSQHKSQFDENSLKMLSFYLTERSKQYAKESGKLVETFKVLPPTMLHVFPEALTY